MTWLFSLLVKIGLGGIVERTIGYLEKKADRETERDRMKTQIAIEHIRAAVDETRIMAEFNGAKLNFVAMWCFLALFVVPLGCWWAAVIADSIFHFGWKVADLPTPQMREWAGSMIRWLFYTGTTVGAIKGLSR